MISCIFTFLSSSYVTEDEWYKLRAFADKGIVINRIYAVH